MKRADERAAADQRRNDIILQSIKAGLSNRALAARIGIEEDYAKKLRVDVAKKHGITLDGGKTPAMPYGITTDSQLFRNRLRDRLDNLIRRRRLHPIDVSLAIGIPERAQTRNRTAGGKNQSPHDWKLSELERLAKLEGVDFLQMMAELLRPRDFGEL